MDYLRIQVYKYEKAGLSNLFEDPTENLDDDRKSKT